MKTRFLFSASLRLRHPSMGAAEIVSIFGREPKVAQSAHEPRMTRTGKVLPGRYECTYVVFPLDIDGYDFPDEFLSAHLADAGSAEQLAIRRAVGAGCSVQYFFGISCPGNSGFELSASLIEAVQKSSVSLSFDIYGHE